MEQLNVPVQTTTAEISGEVLDKVEAAPVVEPPKVEDKKESNSAAISAIAKEKRRVLAMKRQMDTERAMLRKEMDDMKRERESWAKISNPIEALQAKGWSYKDATDYVLNNKEMTPELQVKAVRDEIASFKKEQQEKDQLAQQRQAEEAKKRVEETISTFKENITDYISNNAETYELINLHGQQDAVFDTIEVYFNRTQKVMTMKEACDHVEKYLEEQVERTIKDTKKFKSRFTQPEVKKEEKLTANQARTLSNNMTSSAPSLLPAKTEADRIKRALAVLDTK